ncbi:uncharacterized protein LOC122722469 [Manihot esculenta]|uniref:uncharacterized protein LOC122722469 n=1 Tax=Manihot esculenta TaxID=3983 RepID=UPI001CC65F45|nr:uncharacterized protein LOC122722469 [Manihot esculenta]
MPSMTAYDGAGNPREHVLNYKTFIELQTLSDALMCKAFPMTLSGPVRAWFNNLEAGSISSFGDLATRFISRFIAGVPADRKTSYLETIKQRRDESLREYVARFNTEALQIPELDEGRAVEAMQKGTTSAEFFSSLSRKPPTSLAELMQRAEKYIRQDDALVTSRFAKEAVGKEKAPEERRPEKHERKHEIERLIKRGHLKNFVKKPEEQRPQPNSATQASRRAGAVNDGSSGTINMIVGGTGGRMSHRGKKRSREGESSGAEVMQVIEHSLVAITFSPEDAQGVQMPHDDALVIEAVIHNYRVKKILVDDGSKVNLLPYRVFKQMGTPEEQLVRDQAPVKGIRGVPVSVEGKVKLALTLGEAPRTRTHYAVFLVVKLPLSYNAILGRPALFDFEVVTSIRYLAMKFPTEAWVGIVRGSQEEARAVYLATVAEPSSTEERLDSKVLEVRDEKTEARTEPVGELEIFPLSEVETDKTGKAEEEGSRKGEAIGYQGGGTEARRGRLY